MERVKMLFFALLFTAFILTSCDEQKEPDAFRDSIYWAEKDVGRMTKEQLEAYKSKKDEICELQYKLKHLGEGDSLIASDVILDYRDGFPRPQSVVGYDYEKEKRLKNLWTKQIEVLKADCAEIEQWIEAIPDSLTRRIFRMKYVNGMTQDKIAKLVHLSQASVSKKIKCFLKME